MSRPALLSFLAVLLTCLVGALLLGRCSSDGLSRGDGAAPGAEPTVLLLSIDGFRADYLDRYEAPTLERLAAEGVRGALIPAFPSKTFPNHYTIVTGLYPSHHGVVGNTMYDSERRAWFSLSDRDAIADSAWWGGEPLWVTAERQGLKAATFFWPGSEAAIGGVRPSYWKPYDGKVPGLARVEQVLAWLDLPRGERPRFITLYFSDVDSEGHDYGPDSPEVAEAIAEVDAYLAALVEGLEARNLLGAVDLIVVSDHGMAATSPERVVVLSDYVDLDEVTTISGSPVVGLRPKGDAGAAAVDALYAALHEAHPHLAVYRRGEAPEAWRFDAHPRIPPLLAVADEGWTVAATRPPADDPGHGGGTHGYDPRLPSMHALFVARGPSFAKGARTAPFENVHLYSLMASILNLEPAPNDGNPEAWRPFVRTQRLRVPSHP